MPSSYINYDGYQAYSCLYQQTNIVYWDEGLNPPNWSYVEFNPQIFPVPAREPCTEGNTNPDGSCNDNGYTWVDWFPNFFCGYVDPVKSDEPDWWRRGGKTIDMDGQNPRTIKETSSLREGYRRFRVYLDPASKPKSKNYAVLGMNINNLDYVHPNDVQELDDYYFTQFHSISDQGTPYYKNNNTHAYYVRWYIWVLIWCLSIYSH